MPRKTSKTAIVAFKVEKQLADLLNKLRNKSDFIRKAIVAQPGMACPLCNGRGVVSRGVHDYFAPFVSKMSQAHCDSCGDKMAIPREPGDLADEDRSRLEQFFHGGPLLCDGCYDKSPTCNYEGCGWHIAPDKVAQHVHQAHRN